MIDKLEWKQAFGLITISLVVSFIAFLMSEIIWGDLLKSSLSSDYKRHQYSNINLILILGLGFIFLNSIIVNLSIFREYTEKSKVKCNLIAFLLTFVILYAISSVSIIIIFAKQYAGLNIIQKMRISWLFFSYFSVYVLPTPILFWIMALVIFHVILLFLIKAFLVRKISFKIKSNKKSNKNKTNKYSVLG